MIDKELIDILKQDVDKICIDDGSDGRVDQFDNTTVQVIIESPWSHDFAVLHNMYCEVDDMPIPDNAEAFYLKDIIIIDEKYNMTYIIYLDLQCPSEANSGYVVQELQIFNKQGTAKELLPTNFVKTIAYITEKTNE